MYRRIFLLTFCLISGMISHGQNAPDSRYKYDIGVNMHPGFLVAHRDDSRNLEAHTLGFEVQYTRQYRKEKDHVTWASFYSAPRLGVNFLFMSLGQPNLTGDVYAIIPNFETSFKVLRKSELRFRVGTGLGYLTRKFDPNSNRHNLAIGSHVNGSMQLFVSWNKNWGVLRSKVGIGMTHFSNGSFRVPNLGVNMPSLMFGLNYPFGEYHPDHNTGDSLPDCKYQVSVSYAFKQLSLANPTPFNIVIFNGARIFRRNMVSDWRLGGDIFLDKQHMFLAHPDEPRVGLKPWQMTELGVFAGHQWLINRVHLITDIGFYLYKPSKYKFFTYQRLGLLVNVTDHVFVNSTLKVHFGVADFFDWGIGYRIGV